MELPWAELLIREVLLSSVVGRDLLSVHGVELLLRVAKVTLILLRCVAVMDR